MFKKYKEFNIDPEYEKNLLEMEYSANKQYFNELKSKIQDDKNRNIDEINRLLQYSKTDYINNLIANNKAFARNFQRITNNFSSRNLLGSGIQKAYGQTETTDLQKKIANMEDYQRRKEESYIKSRDYTISKYNEGLRDIKRNEDYLAYSQLLKNKQNLQNEYLREYKQTQDNPFYVTQQTQQRNGGYNNVDVYRKTILGKSKRELENNTINQIKKQKIKTFGNTNIIDYN